MFFVFSDAKVMRLLPPTKIIAQVSVHGVATCPLFCDNNQKGFVYMSQ